MLMLTVVAISWAGFRVMVEVNVRAEVRVRVRGSVNRLRWKNSSPPRQ